MESTDKSQSKPTKICTNARVIGQVKALILDHLVQVGRTYDLPADQQEQHVFVSRWHQTVCEDNSHWPHDVDVIQVYKAFFRAVRDGRFQMPNFSAYSHSQAFKEWAKLGLAKYRNPNKALNAPDPHVLWQREQERKPLPVRLQEIQQNLEMCRQNNWHTLPESTPRRQAYESYLCELANLQERLQTQAGAA